MAVSGVFTSDANIQGTKRGDFASAILQIEPQGRSPLLALSSGMKKRSAADIVVTWFEETHISGRAKVTSGGNSSATSITVDDGSSYYAGVELEVQDTGELIFVTAVSGNVLTIERGFAGTTAGTIGTTTTYVQRIGTLFEENSSRPTAIANIGYPRFNYMQIFRNAWDVSGTAQAVQYITGDIVAKNKKDAASFHAEDIERSFWWGRKILGVKNGRPFRGMDGILTQISTNDEDAGATTTWDELDAFLRVIFEKNVKGQPNERIAFGGNGALAVINKIARLNGVIQLFPGQTDFGMKVTKWITPYGEISIMTHPLMVENAEWTKDLHILHPGAIETRWLRDTHLTDYPEDAGVDGDYGVYTSECSIMYMAEVTGGSMTGFTAGATS